MVFLWVCNIMGNKNNTSGFILVSFSYISIQKKNSTSKQFCKGSQPRVYIFLKNNLPPSFKNKFSPQNKGMFAWN